VEGGALIWDSDRPGEISPILQSETVADLLAMVRLTEGRRDQPSILAKAGHDVDGDVSGHHEDRMDVLLLVQEYGLVQQVKHGFRLTELGRRLADGSIDVGLPHREDSVLPLTG
jgi:hypothetical protein